MMAQFVKCDHCGTDNLFENTTCTQCGAPLRHDFGRMSWDGLREALLPTAQASTWPVALVDLSRYNGQVDFAKLATKAQGVIIQSSYGTNGTDSAYARNLNGAVAHGLVPFIYHFLKPSRDWRKTAQFFAEIWEDGPKIGYPWADLEDAEGLDKAALMGWTEKFWREFEELSGLSEKLGCYTSPGFLNRSMNLTNWLKLRPLWVAHWTTAATPVLPNEWSAIHNPKTWKLWQWKVYKPGSDYGSGSGAIDLNRYNGTVAQFNAEFGTDIKELGDLPVPPPPTPPPDEIHPLYQVTATGTPYVNFRGGPKVTNTDIGNALPGDVLPIVEEKDGWGRVEGWVNLQFTKKI